ncbi:hypothetical protein ACELLULO517_18050 [Acidisoma cellulosilytica]|uniref:Leucyl aminopeptidase n=1 Tax=Acidisoma cellulosilyticum TaxID=2802395 RepID=A0A963Z3K9_9PROT|nr:hypothetical protein [Acidisoma cellulosilyticum]MCB8882154.1 hypothetical protein [Acidisoma cellulosilyticum]
MQTMMRGDQYLDLAIRTLVETHFAIQAGESVLITADGTADAALVEGLMQAVQRCGARPMTGLLPQLPFQGALADPFVPDSLIAAAAASDVWLDFCFPYLAGSRMHAAALKAGRVRYGLLNMPSAKSFGRIYGGVAFPALMDFQVALVEWLDSVAGQEAHVTCPLGTDVRFELDTVKIKRHRVANIPGMHTTPGAQNIYPKDKTAHGKVVLQALFDEHYRILRRPLTIEVDGSITQFSGGGAEDGPTLERSLRRAAGGQGYGRLIHFTMGFHPAARFTGQSFSEDIRVPGTNAIGMGLPWWEEGGGENHPDGVVLDQTLTVNGELIQDCGRFVGPAALRPLHDKLLPLLF